MVYSPKWKIEAASTAVVTDYLRLPLDEAMNRLWRRYALFYVRYMDGFVLMAPTRHKLRRAIKEVHAVMGDLELRLHATKRCIGQI